MAITIPITTECQAQDLNSINFLKIYFNLCVCVCANTHKNQRMLLDTMGLELQTVWRHPIWMLETELRSSRSAPWALSC